MMRAPAMLRCSLSDVDCFLINQTELWSQTFILFSSRKVVLETSLERVSSAVFILTKRIKLDHLQLDICEEEEEEEGRGELVGAGSCQSMTGVSAVLSPGNSSDSHQTPLTCPSSGYFYIFSLAERNAFNECFLHFSFYKECKLLLSWQVLRKHTSTHKRSPAGSWLGLDCWDVSLDMRSRMTGGAAIGIVSLIMFCWLDNWFMILVFLLNLVLLLIVINTYLWCLLCWQQIYSHHHSQLRIFCVFHSEIFSLGEIRENPAHLQENKSSLDVHPSLQETPYQTADCLW